MFYYFQGGGVSKSAQNEVHTIDYFWIICLLVIDILLPVINTFN